MKHSSKRFFGILLGLVLLLALVLTFSLSVCAFAGDVAYNVIIAGDIQYGGVAVDPSSATEGETVTLTATPDTDCNLLEIGAEAGRAETVADIIAAIGTASFTDDDDTDDTDYTFIVSKDSLTVIVSEDGLEISSYSIAAEKKIYRSSDVSFYTTDDSFNWWTFTLSGETGKITKITCSSGTFSGESDYFLIKPVVLTPDTTNPNVYTFSMPAAPVTVSAEFEKLYPLWVGGTQITSTNLGTSWGEWSFDPNTATLELRGATITGAYQSAAIYAESMDLIINVNSDSTVTGPDGGYGIWVNSSDDGSQSITINGDGRLSVTGGSTCVKVSGSIIVNGTLSAATGTTGNDDKYGVDGNIVINQGAVVAVTGTTQAIRGTVKNDIAGLGWTDVSGVEGEAVIDVSEGQALNDYKKVQFPYYTVSFDTDGGEPVIEPVIVAVGSTIAAPTTPTKVNMVFTGWFDGTNSVTFPYTPPGDVTLTAQWTNAVASITRNGKTSYYTTLQHAFNVAVDDDIVRMISDVMMERDLFVRNKRITLDLNDHGLFIKYSVIGFKILWVENSGSLTLTDNAENKTVHNIEMGMSGEMYLPADKPLFRGWFPATGNEENKTIEVTGGYIAGGYASGGSGGGGVRVKSGSSFTMTGGTICACTTSMTSAGLGDSGGGVYVDADCSFTMTGGTIRDNNSYGNGGGVYVAGTFTMTGGTIRNNNSYGNGGGVYVNGGGSFTMTGGTISGNTAPAGGGVDVYGGTFTMNGDNAAISGNTATNFGGGVCLEDVSGSKFILENGAVSGNTAGSFGGGVFIWPNGTLEMSGGEIGGATEVGQNTAAAGGGVTVWGGTLTMSGGTICGNNAAAGGGVDVNGGTFTMNGDNAAISGNTATNFGGGVCLEDVSGSKFILKNGAVSGNTAGSFGGGVFIWLNGTLEMSGGEISDNIATSFDGGGVTVWDGGALQMTGGSISGNSAPRNGGGVYVNGNSTLQVSGKAFVTGNLQGEAENNVYLDTGKIVTVSGALEDIARIGVTMQTPGVFTSGWASYMGTADPAQYFSSDDADYASRLDTGGELTLKKLYSVTVADSIQGGSVSVSPAQSDGKYAVGDTITLLATPSDGYVFNSYTVTDADGQAVEVAEDNTFTMPAGNVTVSAKFSPIYTVSFDADGGTPVPEAQLVESGKNATYPDTVPTRDGSSFGGWYLNDAPFHFSSTPITGDVTLTAKWKANQYTIIWVDADGTYLAATTAAHGETPTFEPPVRMPDAQFAYAFDAWDPAPQPATATAVYRATYIPVPLFGPPTFTLPASTKSVGESAFEGLPMTIAEIPSGCTSIGANAFKDCANLTQIRIPASVTSIDATAFEGCEKVLVYGTINSTAQTFCADHANCAFVAEN